MHKTFYEFCVFERKFFRYMHNLVNFYANRGFMRDLRYLKMCKNDGRICVFYSGLCWLLGE